MAPVPRLGALVEDVGLVAGAVGDLLGIETTKVDAAVRVMTRPEFDARDEILVRFLAHQVARDGLEAI
jgi:hypothetical protein